MDVKITDLPEATTVNDNDVLPIVQSGTTKQIAKSLLAKNNAVELFNGIESVSGSITLNDNLSNYLWIDIVWGAITPKTNVTNVDNDMETTGMTFGTKRVYYPNNKSITINNIWGSKYSSTNKAIGLIMGYRQLYLSGTTIATDNNIAGWVNISRAYESQNTDTKVFFIYAVYGQKK